MDADIPVGPREAVKGVFYSQWAYWVTLAMTAWSYVYLPPGGVRTLLILTPILPALLSVATTYWIYRCCDEFIRFRILKCVVLTALGIAFYTLGYFFLELFGFPRSSMLTVNLLGWSLFNLQILYVVIQSR